ncbi:hypothetical protein ABPG72_014731 [Tetrahymena utriculariae]
MIKGIQKIVKQQGFFSLQLLNKVIVSHQQRIYQFFQAELHKSQKFYFARLSGQSKNLNKQDLKQNDLDDACEDQVQNENHEQNTQNEQHFELTAETFDKMLYAIKEKGQSLIEVICQSDLQDKIINSQLKDKYALISCLRVLEKCQILDNTLRESIYQQIKQPYLLNASYTNQELGVILEYFMLKNQKKLYLIEFESFYLQRLEQLEEKHIRQLVKIYSQHFKGSTEFYDAIQLRILNIIENPSQNKLTFSDMMNTYLPAFTKSNYFNQKMEAYFIKQIEQRVLAEEYQQYFKETILPYVPNILFFFALQFESTQNMHETLLKLIKIHHQKNRSLPLHISKPLNIFLKVYSLFTNKEVDDFFMPAFRYKNMHVQSSRVQDQIQPYLLKFIPKIHLKENYYIDSFNVDFFTYLDGKKIVIEINGRFHYFHNRYSGVYQIKHTCLEKQGYIIVEIKDYDWNALEENQKETYIARLLSPHIQKANTYLDKQK